MKLHTEQYKGYTIEDHYNGWSMTFQAYPANEGPQDDYDLVGDSYQYCGNCLYGTIEDLKIQIDEKE